MDIIQMDIIQIPTLFDNYTYLIVCKQTGLTAIVDSPDAEATLEVIRFHQLNPVAIFSTHHHLDHVGGNPDLIREKKMNVYGGAYDRGRIPELTHPLKEGEIIKIGSLSFNILHIPGHTSGHIAYVTEGAVFCGDTLFAGGCGRLFEGTPEHMVASLTKLKNLPDDTNVYCGHEYTQKNLEFASQLEPHHLALQKKYEEVVKKRKRNEPTVPTTIGEEKSYNPFLRWDDSELVFALKKKIPYLNEDPVSVFAATRKLKDAF